MPTAFYYTPQIVPGPSITPRNIFTTVDSVMTGNVPNGYFIAGALSRDTGQGATSGNNTSLLRCGLMMGQVSGGTYDGMYRPSIIGVLNRTGSTTATTLTLQPAVATEVQRLITLVGTSNNFIIVSPTTSGGTVVSTTVSATSATTGANSSTSYMTLSASINTLTVAGGVVTATDSSGTPVTVLSQNVFGTDVTDLAGNSITQPMPAFIVKGDFITQMIPNLLADDYGVTVDSAVTAVFMTRLRAAGQQFTFSSDR